MLVQVQPWQAAVGPDVPLGRGQFGVVEGGDGHVDAFRAQVSGQRKLRPTVAAEISHAGGRRVIPRRYPGQPMKGRCGHGDPRGHEAAADPSANRAMTMGDIVQRPAELIAQLPAVTAASVKCVHLVFLPSPYRWAQPCPTTGCTSGQCFHRRKLAESFPD
jgi:hypothetical protein